MSHHLSGPNLQSPAGDARLDLSDVFAFAAPGDDRCVLIMDANPDFGAQADAFHPDAVYQINVDTDGDDRADIAFSFVFSPPRDGAQIVSVYRATGEQAHEAVGEEIIADAPVSFASEPRVVESSTYRFFAGLRSDPFFADLEGIQNDFQWTGVDTMAEANVFGIVLELPNSELGADPTIGVWARVSLHRDGELISIDRGAHPSLTAYFNEEDAKDEYNRGEPADDWEKYREPWTAVLQHTGGYSREEAEEALRVVLPDILRYDRGKPAAYPNGRALTDDVTSARLDMISGGKVPTDHIGPHTDLLPEFPYLGNPHIR
ncbi:MAG: DUF4331 family protein [Rubrobacteraceae bacterium]